MRLPAVNRKVFPVTARPLAVSCGDAGSSRLGFRLDFPVQVRDGALHQTLIEVHGTPRAFGDAAAAGGAGSSAT